ncbi:MAG: pilin [Patescibacteria group bacterium]
MKHSKLLNPSLLYIILLSIVFCLLPLLVFAQDEFGFWETAHRTLPTGTPSIAAVVATVIQIILGLVGVVLLIMILYGGWQWMTSAGNEQKIAKAKAIFGGAVIGLFIILAAYTVTSFIMRNVYLSIQPLPTIQVCKVPSDCSPGQICGASGVCITLTGSPVGCIDDSVCEFGQTCSDGVCVDSTPPEPEIETSCPGVCLEDNMLVPPGCIMFGAGDAYCLRTTFNPDIHCYVDNSPQICTVP